MFYTTSNGHGLPHNPFNALVVPRPIGWVSTLSVDGVANLAPYSFFNAVGYTPPQVMFSAGRRSEGGRKDSAVNAEETGEFVVNLATWELRAQMNASSVPAPADVDEFEIAGLTQAKSTLIKPPRVAETPVAFECRLNQVVQIGSGNSESGLVIGDIALVHIRDDIINGHRIDQQKLRPTGRLAGSMYCHTLDVFEMVRPAYSPNDG